MKILTKKSELSAETFRDISNAQDRAFEMVKNHLAEPIKSIEAMGYSRLELACAYLSLAYHALRYGRPKEQAEKNFPILAHFACLRMEENFKQYRGRTIN